MFHLYVSKVDQVLHMLHALMVAVAAWCCCQGATVVHVRARNGRGKPGAAAGGAPWFTCGCGGA
jgi:hypothetical protein